MRENKFTCSTWLRGLCIGGIGFVVVGLVILPLGQYFYSGYENALGMFWHDLAAIGGYLIISVCIYVPMFVSEYVVKNVSNDSLRELLGILLSVMLALIFLYGAWYIYKLVQSQ